LLIDTSTDFRQQALRAKIPKVDAVLYTHPHSDHIGGIDDLRAYNFLQNDIIPVYGNWWTQSDLLTRFGYVFSHLPSEGGGLPKLSFHLIEKSLVPIEVAGVEVIPVELPHGKNQVLAYRLGDMAYVTDIHEISSEAIRALYGVHVLILDCVRVAPHRTHLNLDCALFYASKIQARKTVLTHLGHEFEYSRTQKQLPKGVTLGFDGQKIRFKAKMKAGW
jgi:phosphoribosyl 1,2-cyclic phosphate phosphodiesterase